MFLKVYSIFLYQLQLKKGWAVTRMIIDFLLLLSWRELCLYLELTLKILPLIFIFQ